MSPLCQKMLQDMTVRGLVSNKAKTIRLAVPGKIQREVLPSRSHAQKGEASGDLGDHRADIEGDGSHQLKAP